MDDTGVYIFVGIVAYLALWLGYAALRPIEGIWKRTDAEDEYVSFTQFGPFISGKRNVDGGNHVYLGMQTFNRVRLVRRDYGIPALIAVGFPPNIAKAVNGSVMAKLTLKRRADGALSGSFRPQKVLFDEATGSVLSRHYQAATPRLYTLTELTALPASTKGVARTRHAELPAPEQAKKKRRNTF